MDERVLECVYAAVEEANEDRPELPPLKKSPETPVYGAEGGLDSLGLINFLVAVEESVERGLGATIVVSDDRVLSAEPSPLRSIGALAEYVTLLVEESE